VNCPIRRRAIEWIGVFSYSIYLWHYFLVILFRRYQPSFGVFWLYVACCILLGVGTAKLVEFPVLRLRDRLFAGEAR
jgi:peptidoglycan/LPS O-acetylase OafA/YrhL